MRDTYVQIQLIKLVVVMGARECRRNCPARYIEEPNLSVMRGVSTDQCDSQDLIMI